MSENVLARLLEHPGIWRGRSLTLARTDTLSSGFPALDAHLAGGGWPKVGLVEILTPQLGSGELRLLLPLLAAVTRQPHSRWCTWIAPPLNPYAPALCAQGVNLARLLVVQATQGARAPEWATEQALISGACDVVLTWITQPLKPRIVRRLQLAAQRGRTLAFLLRPWSERVAHEPSHALLRLGVEPQGTGVRLSILKSRGGVVGQWWLNLEAAPAAGV